MVRFDQGWPYLLGAAALSIIALAVIPVFFVVFALIFGFMLFFFRDPERTSSKDRRQIVGAADGRVLEVVTEYDPHVGECKRVAVFMDIWDVHVNRAPLDGTIKKITHTRGKKITAFKGGPLDVRERQRFDFDGSIKYSLIQYAGLLARRTVSFIKPGEKIVKGERIGMIKFSSRVDVIMPNVVKVLVKKGDRVVAGETVIGELDA